ncbi:signal peptide peptidase-domain-containing protein [Xylaria bambusicola]|uniref:signal peptide peptidase-domain-containing protein n=1 Tax=Xylaria bambusicola TaxID=326684 RepID=UPI0020087E38|nr:signal peptide peptidase-domain-containing protein [Xylaria bambusicola]KAI0522202.1 signal peptide peptidase-domain-containing protein [Xylaria bambusicola]
MNQTFCEKLASAPGLLLQHKGLLVLETRIVLTALALIYVGSYGSLRRPHSAKIPKASKKENKDEERDDQYVQGMLPSDAIMIPILAATVLTGLYYLIKWLEDADTLNKIFRAYFSTMSLASLGKFFADSLHFLTGFVFPSVWISRDGKVFHIDPEKRGQWYTKDGAKDRVWDDTKISPLPGRFSNLKLSGATTKFLWEIRHLLSEDWTVRLAMHGVANEKIKVKAYDIVGFVFAIGANVFYYTTPSVFLSNIMGYAFSYAGIMIMSPTTFATGSAVLFSLFIYDIVMVFYTPYMVTVATKLDAPIKLVFEGPTRASMLGLGDIVVPGIFIALCLRFDLYMYYYRKQNLKEVELRSDDVSSGHLVTHKGTQRMVVKPDYISPQGQWGDRFWGTKFNRFFSPDVTPAAQVSAFPKPYFYASMVGYLLAMTTTLVMLLVFQHAQPALLYIVPGVVASVWLTGLVRGEIRQMWNFTEDGSLDKVDVLVEVDGNGNVIKEIREEEDKDKEKEKGEKDDTKNDGDEKIAEADDKPNHEAITTKKVPVFLLSLEAPAPRQ